MNQRIIKNRVAEFGKHMQSGTQHLFRACCIYAATITEDYTATEAFCKAFPLVSKTTWDKMRLVGVGAIEPTLLLLSDRLCGKLARLPLAEQKAMCGTQIKVVKPSGRVISKDIREITEKEEKRVFAANMHLRTVAEQKKEIRAKKSAVSTARPYSVEGETLRVFRACLISKTELAVIVKQMKG